MKQKDELLVFIVLLFAALLCVGGLYVSATEDLDKAHQHAEQLERANKALAEQLRQQAAICWSKETE